MSISILLPALSPSMERGNIVRWLKREGERVSRGEAIAEIETDKATMEIEAFDDGVLSQILRPGGSQDVGVNEVIAVLNGRAGDADPQSGSANRMAGSPDVRLAGDSAVVPRVLPQRSLASPLARRIARKTQIDLGAIAGSGPHGRIVRRDVEEKLSDRSARSVGVAAGKTLPDAGDDAPGVRRIVRMFEPGTYEEIRIDGTRRTIASRLVAATQTVPHFNLTADCTTDALLKLRDELTSAPGGGRPTLNDWIVKALAVCLQIVPEANVVWAEDRILRLRHSDIGVAVAAEGGLRTPVIRAAETKSLSAVSEGIKALVRMAREQTLSAEDCAGGSCAVSNLGMHGVSSFQPVINPPHAFVLGIGAVEERLVSRNGQPASIHAFTVTMSCDHRVMDGALAARLLAAFKATVEEPMRILV